MTIFPTTVTIDTANVQENVGSDVLPASEEAAMQFLDIPGNSSEGAGGEEGDVYTSVNVETEQAPSTEVAAGTRSLPIQQVTCNH